MDRHHDGLLFKKLEDDDYINCKIDSKVFKGGGSRKSGHGFKKDNNHAKKRW